MTDLHEQLLALRALNKALLDLFCVLPNDVARNLDPIWTPISQAITVLRSYERVPPMVKPPEPEKGGP